MRIILLLLVFFCFFKSINASHFNGGEIYYEFIGMHPNGGANYKVHMVIFDGPNWPFTGPAYLDYGSSCDSGGFVVMTPAIVPLYAQNLTCTEIYDSSSQSHWEVIVHLPVNCSDWEFSLYGSSSSPAFTNILSLSILIVRARLNNNLGQNSSPRFIDPATRRFCLSGTQLVWHQRAIESDSDSLVYKFGDFQPNWAPGFSVTNPFTTDNGILIDSARGNFTFQVSSPESIYLSVIVEEYRFNTLNSQWVFVGNTERQFGFVVYGACDSSAINWSINGLNDSVVKKDLQAACNSQRLSIPVPSWYQCSSLTETDFALYRSSGGTVPIINAESNCQFGFADSLFLDLFLPLNQNDTLYLVSRLGNDGNTLIGRCGTSLPVGDTTLVVVNGCSSGVGLSKNNFDPISVFPNPTEGTIELKYLEEFNSVELTWFAITGEQLGSKVILTNSEKRRLSVPGFSGTYLLRVVINGENPVVHRVVKY